MKFPALGLILLSLFTGSAAITRPQQSGSGKAKDVVEVQLNLSVKDARGGAVPDLNREAVTILEDRVPQTITSFERKDADLRVGLVLDATGSMRTQQDRIKGFAKRLLAGFGDGDEAFIVRFVDTGKISLVRDWTSDRSLLARSVDSQTIEPGQSAVLSGLAFAANHLVERAGSDNSHRYALILISDCEERTPAANETELRAKFRSRGIQIFVVAPTDALSSEGRFMAQNPRTNAESLAHRIAFNSGGDAYLTTQTDLAAIVPRVLAELRSPYVVRYLSTNTKRSDDHRRKLQVTITPDVSGASRQGTLRDSIVVPKN